MKRLVCNLIFILLLITVISSCTTSKKSTISSTTFDKNSLVGTWELCDTKDSLPALMISDEDTIIERKIITPETFTVLHLRKNESKKIVYSIFTGACFTNDAIYTEKIEYAATGNEGFIGVNNSFKFKFVKDLLFVTGVNNPYNQIWRRVKK